MLIDFDQLEFKSVEGMSEDEIKRKIRPGVVLKLKPAESDTPERDVRNLYEKDNLIVGDVNILLGGCDCCSFSHDWIESIAEIPIKRSE